MRELRRPMTTATPSAWVTRWTPLVPKGGSVLDLACGQGRHTRHFRERDHPVTAVDRDTSQIAGAPGLTLITADLEDGSPWPLPGATFAAVVVTNYLWRPHFFHIIDAIAGGGVLLYETFAAGHQAYGRPRTADFLLQRGELLTVADGLTVVAYEDGILSDRKVVQRICAIRNPDPVPLFGSA